MQAFYKFSFDRAAYNILIIDAGTKLVEEHLWDFPITFLSTDFQSLLDQFRRHDVSEQQIREEFTATHTFLEFSLLPLAFEENKQRWIEVLLEKLIALQNDFRTIVQNVFVPSQESLSTLQRMCRYLDMNKLLAARFYKAAECSKVETVYYVGGKEFVPQLSWQSYDYSQEIHSLLMFGSDILEAALFLIVQRMAERNLALRQCSHCGRYFHPFSVRSIYCDRIDPQTGKTCKEQASKLKYEEKIAADVGRTLFQRRSKTYSMRVSRSPAIYKKSDYLVWKNKAAEALETYISGQITCDDLDLRLTLPDKK